MAKRIWLKQLAEKKYTLVEGLSENFKRSIGEIEDSWDMIIYGPSGAGKSNFTAQLIIELITALDCVVEYVAYEEGHGKTVQDTMIGRQDMLNKVGNKLALTDRYSYDELVTAMAKRRSAKIWVIDSLQATDFTAAQCLKLKHRFVKPKNGKILIFISWAEGKEPLGGVGRSVKYYANIKVMVKQFIAFFTSRYGGNCNYMINEAEAKKRWGVKDFNKLKKQ